MLGVTLSSRNLLKFLILSHNIISEDCVQTRRMKNGQLWGYFHYQLDFGVQSIGPTQGLCLPQVAHLQVGLRNTFWAGKVRGRELKICRREPHIWSLVLHVPCQHHQPGPQQTNPFWSCVDVGCILSTNKQSSKSVLEVIPCFLAVLPSFSNISSGDILDYRTVGALWTKLCPLHPHSQVVI